uniref:Perforin 1.9 n=1 Tax=Sinocyclocheilus anshuiensis TaxID=1608454 RepID=A0A671RFZ3_9TELE
MIPVILWSGLLLYLPPPTSPACFLGKEAECQDANFVPGSDLAGEDFDITKIQRLGTFVIDMCKWQLKNNTCNLCKNPFMQDKKQKLPVSVIYWRATQNCRRSLYSSVYESSESLVSSSTSSVENNWKAGLGIGNVATIRDYILQRALWRNCSTPCKASIATNLKQPCVCSCHNNPGVKANCCPASGLWGDYFSQTDMYVKVLRNHKDFLGETSVIWNQNSPTWNWKFELGSFVLSQFGGLRLEVWDRDNNDFCRLNHGLLYYKTAVTCGPSLAGSSCTEYVGSPMSSHLEKIYVSRHVRPVPKDVLVKMGVL